ncbi:phosphonate-binding protein [Rhodopseudomonas palustris]|uniref:photosynthetic complex assembly protein PuhC n=1 Tax=Rhodopseudomonas palustris TaxID=1076 RepID=UPI00115CC5F5|nr:photosynthetic complex assembly protein PuhC [Rhodopseudomonas palustris]QDL96452.1 phosphonate-binding protein [Rhodopseudomonas palustris]
MSEAAHNLNVPKGVLIAAAAVVLFTIAAAATTSLTGIGHSKMTPPAMVESLDLNFEDSPDGAVLVYRSADRQLVASLQPGQSGFVRVVMHGMARERQKSGIGSTPSFQLARYVNGQYTLTDPVTKKVIDLNAFGADNLRAFAQLMPAGDGADQTTSNNQNPTGKGASK